MLSDTVIGTVGGMWWRTMFVAGLLVVVSVVLGAPAVSAHTGFVESNPKAGTVLQTPVDEITLVFTQEVEPVGDRFLVVHEGTMRQPTGQRTVDGQTWIISFDPPLSDGLSEVRWSVKSTDAHVLKGSFRFTVDDGTTPGPAPSAGPESDEVPQRPVIDGMTGDGGVESAPYSADAGSPERHGGLEHGSSPATGSGIRELSSLSVDERPDIGRSLMTLVVRPDVLGLVGRTLTTGGSLIAIGAMIFLVHLLRGTVGEGRFVVTVLRRAALAVAIGAMIEVVAQTAVETGRWSNAVSPGALFGVLASQFGAGIGFKLIGAFGVAGGSQFRREAIGRHDSNDIRANMSRVGILAGAPSARKVTNHPPLDDVEQVESNLSPPLYRWSPSPASSGAVLGGFALLSAALVDGHTLAGTSWLLPVAVTAVHVVAASVWVGGLIVLFLLLRRRIRSNRRIEVADLVVRYSALATVALISVGLAGMVLTFTTIDSLSELWTTGWGRLVLSKVMLVAVAAGLGAVNHFVVVPRLASARADLSLRLQIKRVVSAEIVVLLTVVAFSAQLVVTAPS